MTKTALLLRLAVSCVAVMTPVAAFALAGASIADDHHRRTALIAGSIALIACTAWWSLVLAAWGEDLWRWTSK